jgi:ABC-type dipeptide/oligopeptide/nickel transport system ATPase component
MNCPAVSGNVVESGAPDQMLTAPWHPYTQALRDAVPLGLERRDRKRSVLPVKAGEAEGGYGFSPALQPGDTALRRS